VSFAVFTLLPAAVGMFLRVFVARRFQSLKECLLLLSALVLLQIMNVVLVKDGSMMAGFTIAIMGVLLVCYLILVIPGWLGLIEFFLVFCIGTLAIFSVGLFHDSTKSGDSGGGYGFMTLFLPMLISPLIFFHWVFISIFRSK
jgi:predicted Na+-dependent transporter